MTFTIEEAVAYGSAGYRSIALTIRYAFPCTRPAEMAVIRDLMGFILPAELAGVYPKPPEEPLYDRGLDPDDANVEL